MKYFTINELTRSATADKLGIVNTPGGEAARNLEALVDNVLDPLREAWGRPLTVTSGFRNAALNKAVGGVAPSQHLTGRAADITAGSRQANKRLFHMAINMGLPFDQLIHEHGTVEEGPDWVHISYDPSRNRRQVIYIKK